MLTKTALKYFLRHLSFLWTSTDYGIVALYSWLWLETVAYNFWAKPWFLSFHLRKLSSFHLGRIKILWIWPGVSNQTLGFFELHFLTLEIHLSLIFTCCLCFMPTFYSLSVVGTWQSFRAVSVFHLESSLAGWMSTAVWTRKEWETWGQKNAVVVRVNMPDTSVALLGLCRDTEKKEAK